jgi:hypothetical protein
MCMWRDMYTISPRVRGVVSRDRELPEFFVDIIEDAVNALHGASITPQFTFRTPKEGGARVVSFRTTEHRLTSMRDAMKKGGEIYLISGLANQLGALTYRFKRSRNFGRLTSWCKAIMKESTTQSERDRTHGPPAPHPQQQQDSSSESE